MATPDQMREKRSQVARFALTYIKEALMQPVNNRYNRPNFLSKLSGEANATANLDFAEGASPWELSGGIAQLWYSVAERALADMFMADNRVGADWPTKDISGFRSAWRTFPDMEIDRGPLQIMLVGLGVDLDIVNLKLLHAAREAGIVRDRGDPRLDVYEHWLAEVQQLDVSERTRLQIERYNTFEKVAKSVSGRGKTTVYFA